MFASASTSSMLETPPEAMICMAYSSDKWR